MIDYEKLQKSLKHLELQFANYQMAQNRPELTDIDREAIRSRLGGIAKEFPDLAPWAAKFAAVK